MSRIFVLHGSNIIRNPGLWQRVLCLVIPLFPFVLTVQDVLAANGDACMLISFEQMSKTMARSIKYIEGDLEVLKDNILRSEATPCKYEFKFRK
jgi:hypothetical protein